jgi:hypothetical protein
MINNKWKELFVLELTKISAGCCQLANTTLGKAAVLLRVTFVYYTQRGTLIPAFL